MSKKTFFRKLLIAGLCVVSSTAVVGAVASCKKKDDDGKKQEEVQSLSVQFDLNGGTGTAAGQSVNLGGKIVKPADPVKSGHTFDGWYLGETKFDFDTEITQDFLSAHISGITLSAKYIADGGSGGSGETEKQPTGVTLDTTSSTSNLNREFNIVASISNASELSAENKVLTWTVEKPDVASITVSSDTLTVTVKCTAVGSTKITAATKNNKTAVYNLTVVNPATGIEITKDGKTIDRISLKATDDSANLVAKILPEGSSDTDVQWSASLDNVVEITPDANDSSKATVKMLQSSSEQFTITATVGGYSSTIFCTCDTYYGVLVNDTQNLILNKNFSEFSTGDVLDEWNGVWGTKGIYGAGNKCTYGDGFNVTITTNPNNNNNNRAEIIDTGAGEVSLVVDFGAVDGVVKGYTNVQLKNVGNSWTPVRIYGVSSEKPAGGEIFGLRTDGGKYKYRLNGGSTVDTGIVTEVTTSVTTLRLYYEIDLSTHKLTVVINGQDFLRDLDIGITEAWGMQFVSGDNNNNDKTMSLDNIAVTHVPLSLESYKEVATANLNAVKARYDTLQEGNIYTTENYNELTGYHTAGLQAIDGALTKEDAVEAYETAVSNMAGVETIAATALREAKEDYIQAQITDVYTDTKKAEYKYNAATLEEKITSFTNAVNAYSGAPEGIGENANVIAAKQALEAVKTDVQVITGAKEAAVEEIEAYKGGSENYEENATAYNQALTAFIENLDSITLDGQEVTAQLVTDLLGQIDDAVAEFKEAVDGIDDDATALANAQAQAKTQIDNLYLTEIAALNPAGDTNYTAAEYEEAMANIDAIRSARKRAVESASTVAGVNAEVAQAQTTISGVITTLKSDLPTAKTKAKEAVDAEIAKAATANPDLADGINALQTELHNDIDGAQNKGDLSEKQTLAIRKINVYVAKERAYEAIESKAQELIDGLQSVAAQNAITAVVTKGNPLDSESWDPDMWNLHIAQETANVDTHKAKVLKHIQDIYDNAIEADYTVTLGTTGETLTVKYGTKLLLEDLKVTAKTVVSATYDGNNIDNTDGLTVYDDITIEVVCEDIANFEPHTEWSANAAVPESGILSDNGLFKLEVPATSELYEKGVGTFKGTTINGTLYEKAINLGNVSKDTLSQQIVITLKDNLSTLTICTICADSTGEKPRDGKTYYVINNGEPIEVDGIAQNYTITDASKLTAGTVIKVYVKNTNNSGGRFYLTKVDAQVKNSTPDVDVKWQLSDGTEYETNLIHYYDALVAPEGTPEGEEGQKFDGWYYTPEGESTPVKFVDGTKFPSGSNIVMTAHFLNPNVIIHYTGNGGTNETKKFYLEDGATITLPEPTSSVEGEVFAYWTKDSVEFNLSDIVKGTSESPAEYTLVAHFESGIPVTGVTITGSSSVEVGSKITLTATVAPDNASNKDVTWAITEGSDCATINAATGELTGVKAGTVKVTATAGGVPSAEFTVTVTSAPSLPQPLTKTGSWSAITAETTILSNSHVGVTAQCAFDQKDGGSHAQSKGTNVLKFTLKKGYKYTITVSAGSSGSGTRKLTLNGEEKTTGAGQTPADCTWTISVPSDAATDTVDYTLTQNGNIRMYAITVTVENL